MEPLPHWNELAACTSTLDPLGVRCVHTRIMCMMWFCFESQYKKRLKDADQSGSSKQATGMESAMKVVNKKAVKGGLI